MISTATLCAVATWRCPHCGTPQADGSRCWVCSRSPMSCSTCRNFRQGVAARLGYCAMDRRREPLGGDEIRACWQPPIQAEPLGGLFALLEAQRGLASSEAAAISVDAGAASTGVPAAPPQLASGAHATSWIPAAPRTPDRALPTIVSDRPHATATPPAVPHQRVGGRPAERPAARPPRPAGRLVEAPVVTPSLRLGFRGDARSLHQAAPPGAPLSTGGSADREGGGALEGRAIGERHPGGHETISGLEPI